jgi:hypothetical protein
MMPMHGHQDPLLAGDAEPMLQELAGELGSMRLELATRNSIINKLYRHVKELENKLAIAESMSEAPPL